MSELDEKQGYEVYRLDEIKEKFKDDIVGLIEYVMEGEIRKKPFQLHKRDIQKWELEYVPKENQRIQEENETNEEKKELLEIINIEDLDDLEITDDIVRRGFDFSKKEDGIFIYPYYNEREEETYKMKFQGVEMTPPRGHFIMVDTDVMNRPFGTYTTETYISEIPRKPGDFRFPHIQKKKDDIKEGKTYIDTKNFYYDYDLEKYIQVIEKTDKKGKEKEESPEMEEFKERMKVITYIKQQFYRLVRIYRKEFISRYENIKNYGVNVNVTDMYLYIFNEYREILNYARHVMPVKLILGHLDAEEYEFLLEKIEEMDEKVLKKINFIEEILRKEDKEKIVFNQEPWDNKYKKEYEELGSNIGSKGFLKEAFNFLTKRIEDKNPPIKTQGYVVKKDEKGFAVRIIPNLGTLETRDFFTEQQWNLDKEREFQRKILEQYNGNLEKEQKIPRIVKAFSTDELANIKHFYKEGNKIQLKALFHEKMKKEKEMQQAFDLHYKELLNYLEEKTPQNGSPN
ncbi:hypothetical protein ACS2B2_25865 [Bacillus cereus group sp. BceL297]|uniref:hypothetical protein n=1 Tax=unclassified Bacillus cereus group TaxID=2750818 RepID=UPI003F24BCEE